MPFLKPTDITHIVVHTSVSDWGDTAEITRWHQARGFVTVGYHKVIQNGYPTYASLKAKKPVAGSDGFAENGRDTDKDGNVEEEFGAHAPGYNNRSLSVCLIGKLPAGAARGSQYTPKQLLTLKVLLLDWMARFKVPVENVLGHYETKNGADQGKTCPDLDMKELRKELKLIQSGYGTV